MAEFILKRFFSIVIVIILKVFECVMNWVKKEPERADHLPALLAKVRLPLLKPTYLADHVATENLIRSSHECR